MAGKFMSVKTIVIPVISLIVMASQLLGTSVVASAAMVDMINNGQEVSIELSKPAYDTAIQGQQQQQTFDWIQLDQLKTFNTFRQNFDSTFNINTVTQGSLNGKSGCLYVDKDGDRNGNTTLEDALRNKVFATKYWADSAVKNKVIALGKEVYTDVSYSDNYALAGAVNAYFNLIPTYENPSAFNPTKSMTREDFYSMLYRATNSVNTVTTDQGFVNAIGGKTMLSDYAQGVDELGFLSINNKSLDGNSYRGSISRAEAVYMIVNAMLPDQLQQVTGKEKAYDDCKNAGDLALKAGFKVKNQDGSITGKDRWQSYTLAYMMQHPEDGMQEEIYKAMVVAKNNNLINETDSRWDEPISNSEAILMVINAGLAQDKLYGYKSEVEYGNANASKFTVASAGLVATGTSSDGAAYGNGWVEQSAQEKTSDPNKKLSSGLTLYEAGQKIQSTINNLKSMGESVDSNMDYINQQCEKLGTTYEEVSKLPVDVMNQTEKKQVEVNNSTVSKSSNQQLVKKETASKYSSNEKASTKKEETAQKKEAAPKKEEAAPKKEESSRSKEIEQQVEKKSQGTSNYDFGTVGSNNSSSVSSSKNTTVSNYKSTGGRRQFTEAEKEAIMEEARQIDERDKALSHGRTGIHATGVNAGTIWNPEADAAASRNNN